MANGDGWARVGGMGMEGSAGRRPWRRVPSASATFDAPSRAPCMARSPHHQDAVRAHTTDGSRDGRSSSSWAWGRLLVSAAAQLSPAAVPSFRWWASAIHSSHRSSVHPASLLSLPSYHVCVSCVCAETTAKTATHTDKQTQQKGKKATGRARQPETQRKTANAHPTQTSA